MSFYEDSTIGDLAVVIAVCQTAYNAKGMLLRFRNASNDADLVEVLTHMISDASEPLFGGVHSHSTLLLRIAEALQGIEDQDQAAIQVTADDGAVTLLLATGGTTVEFP